MVELFDLDPHFHICPRCGHKWSHYTLRTTIEEEYIASHACAKCGTVQMNKAIPDWVPLDLVEAIEVERAQSLAEEEEYGK